MYSPSRESVNGPHFFWQQAMDLPGANEMRFVRRLMESRPVTDRIPDQSIVIEGDLPSHDRIQATRGNDYIFVYTSTGKPFSVNAGKITGNQLNAFWFDPKNGKTKDAGKVDGKIVNKFTPPDSGYGKDWILVIDDASKNYPKP